MIVCGSLGVEESDYLSKIFSCFVGISLRTASVGYFSLHLSSIFSKGFHIQCKRTVNDL